MQNSKGLETGMAVQVYFQKPQTFKNNYTNLSFRQDHFKLNNDFTFNCH